MIWGFSLSMALLDITIEPMKEDDLIEVVKIERDTFKDAWSERMFLSELRDNKGFSFFLSAKLSGRVIGYGGIWIAGNEAQLMNLAVSSDYRSKRVGTNLLCSLLNLVKRMGIEDVFLEVRASNLRAQKFYRRFGFAVIDRRKRYYPDKEDALVMHLRTAEQ